MYIRRGNNYTHFCIFNPLHYFAEGRELGRRGLQGSPKTPKMCVFTHWLGPQIHPLDFHCMCENYRSAWPSEFDLAVLLWQRQPNNDWSAVFAQKWSAVMLQQLSIQKTHLYWLQWTFSIHRWQELKKEQATRMLYCQSSTEYTCKILLWRKVIFL